MKAIDKMIERAYLDSIMVDMSKEEQDGLYKRVSEFKSFMRAEDVSLETLSLLIFLSRVSENGKQEEDSRS